MVAIDHGDVFFVGVGSVTGWLNAELSLSFVGGVHVTPLRRDDCIELVLISSLVFLNLDIWSSRVYNVDIHFIGRLLRFMRFSEILARSAIAGMWRHVDFFHRRKRW